ncbi:hypothetical protein ACFYVL_42670 [Streptomyces sp. NPDC004111]|uniref:hypothetical protein n=1 Tax=Streptomyces sp. NPDC004111 TaxID=3364690 RepID=UPI0036AF051C
MITLSFTPDKERDIPHQATKAIARNQINLESVSVTDLRYGYFDYPTVFRVGAQSFISYPTPIVDLMYCLALCVREIPVGGESDIDFTENSYVIRFVQSGGFLEITSSAGGYATCPADLFYTEARKFIYAGISHIAAEYPVLQRHAAFREIKRIAGIQLS